jgi:competence protein ComEA
VRHLIIAALVAVATIGVFAVPASASQGQAKPVAAKAAPATIVNINTAPAEQLELLPGVGARTASRIIEYRQKNGGFKKVEELMNVRGIGEKAFLRMKNQLAVTPSKAEPQ